MVRAEAQFRLDQNLSKSNRQKKEGHYYVIRWNRKVVKNSSDPLKIIFNYRQSATGREAKQFVRHVDVNHKPLLEFSVIGDAYRKHGRILAWEAKLYQGGKLRAREHSYLW